MTVEVTGGGTVITGEHIALFRLFALRGALRLETLGMKRRGRPASVIVREVTGLKTRDKKKLLAEFEAWIEAKQKGLT